MWKNDGKSLKWEVRSVKSEKGVKKDGGEKQADEKAVGGAG
jgi:hypothetical protein